MVGQWLCRLIPLPDRRRTGSIAKPLFTCRVVNQVVFFIVILIQIINKAAFIIILTATEIVRLLIPIQSSFAEPLSLVAGQLISIQISTVCTSQTVAALSTWV